MTDHLFSPDYDQPVDTRTLVDRMPGTPDAACMCGRAECRWPFDAGCWPDHHNDEEAA